VSRPADGQGAGPDEAQRRRIRRNAALLGLTALGIYVLFIASGVLGWRG
jgi:hypothetical protein